MTFVPGYEHDIFVSYAHVNDEAPVGTDTGWVTTFVNGLKRELAQRLGRADAYSLWMDHELAGNVPVTQEIMANLSQSATLIVVFSQAYAASAWCHKEQTGFLKAVQERIRADTRVFVIELDKAQKPQEFGDLRGYRFFTEDPLKGRPRQLGWPQPQPGDREYYDRIIDLSYDLAEELKRLKTSSEAEPQSLAAAPEDRKTVFLAEVTDDLYAMREDVKGHLVQARFKVLPETYYSREPKAFQSAVRTDLAKSHLFVQLLSGIPFKAFPDMRQGYERCQHQLALELEIPVVQWRAPELDLEALQDREKSDFLRLETVQAVGIEEFKTEIVNRLSPPKSPPVSSYKRAPLVLLKSETSDTDLAAKICQHFRQHKDVSFSHPKPSISSRLVERWILRCDGMMIVYGAVDAEWVEKQYLDILDMIPKRERPFYALAIYDGPPEDKPELSFHAPELQILFCRDCLKEEEIRKFINSLHAGGTL